VIIFEINVEGVFTFKRKRHAPVATHCDAPGSGAISLQLVQAVPANSNPSSIERNLERLTVCVNDRQDRGATPRRSPVSKSRFNPLWQKLFITRLDCNAARYIRQVFNTDVYPDNSVRSKAKESPVKTESDRMLLNSTGLLRRSRASSLNSCRFSRSKVLTC
jgi:hypothetical protein